MKKPLCTICGGEHYKTFCRSNPIAKISRSKTLSRKDGYKIPKKSKSRQKEDMEYNKKNLEFRKTHVKCEARLPGCSGSPDHVHHLYSGASRDKFYTDETTWKIVCNHCHHLIHDVLSKDECYALDLKRTY